jgi:hypothetical protein
MPEPVPGAPEPAPPAEPSLEEEESHAERRRSAETSANAVFFIFNLLKK